MMQINIISSVKQINYHRYVLLVLLVVLMSDRAEPCRGGRLLGKKNILSDFVNS